MLVFAAVFSCADNGNFGPEQVQPTEKFRPKAFDKHAALSKSYAILATDSEDLNFRSVENYGISEAKWSLQAVANTSFSRRSTESDATVSSQSLEVLVAHNGGIVSAADFQAAYLDLHASLAEHYNQVQGTNKRVSNVLLSVASINGNVVTLSGITQVTASSFSQSNPANCDQSFGPTDNYYDGFAGQSSRCDGTDFGNDVRTKIEGQVNTFLASGNHIISPYPSAPIFGGFIGTIDTEDFSQYATSYIEHYASEENGSRDYKLYNYSSLYTDPNPCVNNEDLNWYSCSTYEVVTEFDGPVDQNLSLAAIRVDYDFGLCNGCTAYGHLVNLYYGEPFFVSDGPGYVNPNNGPFNPEVQIDVVEIGMP